MWIICGVLSVIFCVLGWVMASRKKVKACWASFCSLVFVSLTLFMEYRMVWYWVNEEDWSALLDVVPSMFYVLTGYVIIMLLANTAAVAMMWKRK